MGVVPLIEFLRVLNFAFWCKSAEISNFSICKNIHLKVYAMFYTGSNWSFVTFHLLRLELTT